MLKQILFPLLAIIIILLLLQGWQTTILILAAAIFLGILLALLVYSWHYIKNQDNENHHENP